VTARSRLLALSIALSGAIPVAGCAPAVRLVEIDSRPSETRGASIYVNGEKRGVTPQKVKIDFSAGGERRVLIQVVKANYKPGFQYWTVSEVPESKVFELEDE
jgi:hypothetical protein